MTTAGTSKADPSTADVSAAVRPLEQDDFDRNVWSLLGLPVDMATAPEAVTAIEAAVRNGRRLSFVTPNVNFLVRALQDPEQRRQIIDTDLSLVDGAPLVALARLVGAPLKERCAGSDVFEALRLRPGFPGRRLRVFFFGGRDGAAEAAAAAVNKERRGVEAAGFFNPGIGDIDAMSTPEIINAINASRADFVLVALGAAKGQAWIDANQGRLEAPVIAHLGAVLDFTAGSIRRAPPWIRSLGLEWAWRIKEEPSLWRRYGSDALSMAAILFRLMPALVAKGGQASGVATTAAASSINGQIRVALTGDLVAGELAGVRTAFRKAARAGQNVVLDLDAAGPIDAAFLGLVLMLEKNLRATNSSLMLANAGRAHRRLFEAHAMHYPLAAPETIDAESSDHGIAEAV